MTGQTVQRTTPHGAAAAGSIYDLGYQHYEGPRLGRRAAMLALFVESLRACFGIGRPGRAKVVPIGLLVLALLPAVIAVAIEAIAGSRIENPIRYDNYFANVVQLQVLFVAAQAPELVGRDQRYHVLSLYFSRALDRLDYAAAKVGALVAALLVMALLPHVAIFAGKILGSADVARGFGDNIVKAPPILLSSFAAATLMGTIALSVAAFTPRRAYATAAIFALFYITLAVAEVVAESVQGELPRYAHLLAPTSVLDGLTAWTFGAAPSRELRDAPIGGELYVAAAVVMAALALLALARRYTRIAA